MRCRIVSLLLQSKAELASGGIFITRTYLTYCHRSLPLSLLRCITALCFNKVLHNCYVFDDLLVLDYCSTIAARRSLLKRRYMSS